MKAITAVDHRPTTRAGDDTVRPLGEEVPRAAERVVTALAQAQRTGSRDAWLAVAAHCQSLVNSASAVQDVAIVEVARRENVWQEDGTLGETEHTPGRVAIDAADLVAPVLGASHSQAQRRVEQAVQLAGALVPVEVDSPDRPAASGLGGLHRAMGTGQLDGYRASVIAFELEVAPAHVARAVVSALEPHLGDDATGLRRRTRLLLSRISPDLVRERAKRARAATGLRRWVAEPGVDEWHGTFPSEDAALAWAAIDRLAHDLVANGTCTNLEQARGKALTDLVTGNADVDVHVVLTVPADATATSPAQLAAEGAETAPERRSTSVAPATAVGSPARDRDDLVEVQGARPSEPLLVRRGWLRDHLSTTPPRSRSGRPHDRPPRFVPCDPMSGARLDPGDTLATAGYHPASRLAALVRARDGRCRFPGCSIPARSCDLDHVRPWPTGPTSARNLLTLCRRHHRIKQRPGWTVALAPDGGATWIDPTGRQRTTMPLNALSVLVLTADPLDPTGQAGSDDPVDAARAATVGEAHPGRVWSAVETHLALTLEHRARSRHLHQVRDTVHVHLDIHPAGDPGSATHRRCTSVQQLREGLRRRTRPRFPDDPPF